MTEAQIKEMREIIMQCEVCGKQMPLFYRGCVKTTHYLPKRAKTIFVCNNQCKEQWESPYFVEEYKGNKIYYINGGYIPYFGSAYSFTTLEECKQRIDSGYVAFSPFYNYQ